MPIVLPLKDFTYERFIKQIASEESRFIQEQIDEFVKSFCEAALAESPLRQSQGLPQVVLPTSFGDTTASADESSAKESLYARQQRRGKEYLKLLESFGLVIVKDPFWTLYAAGGTKELDHDSDEMAAYFEMIFSYLESYIIPRIHRHLWVPDKKADWDISLKCLEFEFVRPTHLDLPFLPEDMADLIDRCSATFTEMAFEQVPSLKLKFLNTVWKLIQVFLATSREVDAAASPSKTVKNADTILNSITMDDMMPVLVYILIKCHPPQLLSDLNFLVATCRDMTQFGSTASFFVTNTQVAIEFVKNLTVEKLSVASDKDFVPKPNLRLSASSSPAKIPSSVSKPMSSILSVKNRLSTAVGQFADSVADKVSTVTTKVVKSRMGKPSLFSDWALIDSEASSSSTSPAKTPQNTSGKLSTQPSTSGEKESSGATSPPSSSFSAALSPASAADENNLLLEDHPVNTPTKPSPRTKLPPATEMTSLYPFYEKSAADLTPIDFVILLEEYKHLAEFHWKNSSPAT